MTDSELKQKIENSDMLIVYFSTPDCNVCKILRPEVEKVVSALQSVEFLYVDTSSHPMVSGQFVVFAVPTVSLFIDGKEAKRWSRHVSVNEILVVLERYIDLFKK